MSTENMRQAILEAYAEGTPLSTLLQSSHFKAMPIDDQRLVVKQLSNANLSHQPAKSSLIDKAREYGKVGAGAAGMAIALPAVAGLVAGGVQQGFKPVGTKMLLKNVKAGLPVTAGLAVAAAGMGIMDRIISNMDKEKHSVDTMTRLNAIKAKADPEIAIDRFMLTGVGNAPAASNIVSTVGGGLMAPISSQHLGEHSVINDDNVHEIAERVRARNEDALNAHKSGQSVNWDELDRHNDADQDFLNRNT